MASFPITVSVTASDVEKMDGMMKRRRIRKRSEMFRVMLAAMDAHPDLAKLAGAEPVMDGTAVAALARREVAALAGRKPAAGADHMGMGLAAYELALAVARSHMDEILAGVMPVTHGDALAASLDPHGRRAWELCTAVLPRFFQAVLGLDRTPTADMRYEPLDSVDGQYAGVVCGEAVHRSRVYPDGDTIQYVRLDVRTASQTVQVLVPADRLAQDVEVGMTVRAAGVFAVVRQRVVMRACRCRVVRTDGYGAVYGLADEWGLGEAAAARVIRMLKDRHGPDAAAHAEPFAAYARLDRASWNLVLEMPGGVRVGLDPAHVRAGPPNHAGITECMRLWPRVVCRAAL